MIGGPEAGEPPVRFDGVMVGMIVICFEGRAHLPEAPPRRRPPGRIRVDQPSCCRPDESRTGLSPQQARSPVASGDAEALLGRDDDKPDADPRLGEHVNQADYAKRSGRPRTRSLTRGHVTPSSLADWACFSPGASIAFWICGAGPGILALKGSWTPALAGVTV